MSERRKTIPVRLPDDLAASLKRIAAFNGITPAEQMNHAWTFWLGKEARAEGERS